MAAEHSLTIAHRRELCEAFNDEVAARLRPALENGADAFDAALLEYCRTRIGPRFFFDHHNVSKLAADIAAELPEQTATVVGWADAILSHRFQSSDDEYMPYDVQLADDFSWYSLPKTDGGFVFALNRHRFWPHLAMSYRFTGDDRYATELRRQIVSWCAETPPLEDLEDWIKPGINPRWWLLDTAIRADTWVWTYWLMLDSAQWTPQINSLFLYFLWQHGRFLHCNLPLTHKHVPVAGVNWFIMEAQGLLNIALLFPKWKESTQWRTQALSKLEECLDLQFEKDGGHVEQSPSYHECALRWLAEPFHLARLNGCEVNDEVWSRLEAAGEGLYQLMQPDGTVPALSDSDRSAYGVLTQLGLFLHHPEWTRFHAPSARDAWFFGGASETTPQSTPRPAFVAMRESGYYIMRSGDDADAIQLIFDCGPKGEGHGHFDLLGIELYGFGECLIPDPGRLTYDGTPERSWLISTPAHNTLSIDGKNHQALEGSGNPALRVLSWNPQAGNIIIAAEHDGYEYLPGAPQVRRAIWFDGEGVFVIIDQAHSTVDHEYTVAFTLPGSTATLKNNHVSHTGAKHRLRLQALPMPGQEMYLRESFWSPNYGQKETSQRVELRQRITTALFVTVIEVAGLSDEKRSQAFWAKPPSSPEDIEIALHSKNRKQTIQLPSITER